MTNNPNEPRPFHVIAIDGGAASGKSSTSRQIAERCRFLHVDTGSHYRAVAFICLEAGLPPVDTPTLREFLTHLELSSIIQDNESLICFHGTRCLQQEDLRSEAVNQSVSQFAALPFLREAVKEYQRGQIDLARDNGFVGIVMDGRDIGTVILPNADLKIFMKADPATRERRRELEGGSDTILDRDRQDSSRSTAPLKAAEDALVIDNSFMSLEEVVREILQLVPPVFHHS
jgi:cytidylate kinase